MRAHGFAARLSTRTVVTVVFVPCRASGAPVVLCYVCMPLSCGCASHSAGVVLVNSPVGVALICVWIHNNVEFFVLLTAW